MKIWTAVASITRKSRATGKITSTTSVQYCDIDFINLANKLHKAFEVYSNDMIEAVVRYECLDENNRRLW